MQWCKWAIFNTITLLIAAVVAFYMSVIFAIGPGLIGYFLGPLMGGAIFMTGQWLYLPDGAQTSSKWVILNTVAFAGGIVIAAVTLWAFSGGATELFEAEDLSGATRLGMVAGGLAGLAWATVVAAIQWPLLHSQMPHKKQWITAVLASFILVCTTAAGPWFQAMASIYNRLIQGW